MFLPAAILVNVLVVSVFAAGQAGGDIVSSTVDGKFGQAVDLSTAGRYVSIALNDTLTQRPVTFECWVRLNSLGAYNIILAAAAKTGRHWEIYTKPESGHLSVYIPQMQPPDVEGSCALKPGKWHFIAFRLADSGYQLYLDGKEVLNQNSPEKLRFDESPLLLGKIEKEPLRCDGAIDELKISRRSDALDGYVPDGPACANKKTLYLFHFDKVSDGKVVNEASPQAGLEAIVRDLYSIPLGEHYLDEVQDQAYAKSTLHGDDMVEFESRLPVRSLPARPVGKTTVPLVRPGISLSGRWLMKGCQPRQAANMEKNRLAPEAGEGLKKKWFREETDRSNWLEVQVPTSVQNALLQLGKIDDPHWNDNTWKELHEHGRPKDFAWHFRKTRIEAQEWWFARKFTLPADWQGKRIRLYFDGIDYAGSVYLNGKPLGYHEGMFGGPSLDVTHLVRFGGQSNEVVVRVDSVDESWFGHLKGSPGWGWHYGHLISLGIWRDVRIEVLPSVEVESPFVKTKTISDKKAVLEVEYYVRNHQAQPAQLKVVGTITGKAFQSRPLSFVNQVQACHGQSRYQTQITVSEPRLWWPVNYGEQDMYELRLTVCRAEGSRPIDSRQVAFGIRTIEMKPLRGAVEEQDYRWQFVVNGVPMFIKGANWCWTDPMLQQDPDKYEHILELARRGGIQMFRCWGGGIVESDIFYRKCDEKGLMIYQEFPLCWQPPDFPLTDPQVLDKQVTRVIKRKRNHPSLVMWGGGNENTDIPGADEALFLVGRRCRQYDPTRPFHRTDPWGGSFHNWNVFHNGAAIDSGFINNPSQFYGEFGLPSMNNYAAVLKYMPKEKVDTWPPDQNDGGWQMHMNQFGFGDMAKVMRYCDYGPVNNWKTYIDYSQMAQGDEICFACNLQRAGSYFNKGGLWFYKMTDLFPGQSWAVVGYYGHPKLSYYRAKQLFQPRAAFAHYKKLEWKADEPFAASIHVSNDSGTILKNADVKAVIYGSDLKPMWSREYHVDKLAVSTRRDIDQISVNLDPARAKPFLMAVSMHSREGELISDQWYWFNFKAKTEAVRKLEKEVPAWGWPHERAPEAFEAYGALTEARLLSLPRTKLSARLERNGRFGTIRIKNRTPLPAFNVLIDNFPHDYLNYLDDNSFSLQPYEQREVSFELSDKSKSLDALQVRAWNAPPVKVNGN